MIVVDPEAVQRQLWVLATGGGTAILSIGSGCDLELEPHLTEDDIIGCPEFEIRPAFREKLEIGQAVEELLQSLDRED